MDSAANTILSRISALNCGQKPVILAIDGRCASGKTTLAAKIQEKTRCGVIHMDDFFLRPEQRTKERLAQAGGNIDWERIKKEALEPIRANSAALYRPYDCHTQSFKEQIKIEPGPLIVFEGYKKSEVAEKLGCSRSAITQRMKKIKKNLENA